MSRLGIGLTIWIFLKETAGSSECGDVSLYAPAGQLTWLDILATIATNKPDRTSTYTNIAQMLTDAASTSVGASINQMAAVLIPSNLWTSPSVSFAVGISNACGTCLLKFVNDLVNLADSAYLSNECTHSSGFVRPNCIHSMSSALINFNLCNDPLGSSDLVPGTGASRCSQSDIVALDVTYGIYANLVNKALYGSYVSEPSFRNALSNLPCTSCFTGFLTDIQTYGITNMVNSATCGLVFNSNSIYTAACLNAAGSSANQSTKTIATAITKLEQCLGGGFKVALHLATKSQLRCNANELSVLSAYSLYKAIAECSLNNLASFDTTSSTYSSGFSTCMKNTDWGTSAFDLISGTSANSVTCWGCFGALAAGISSEVSSTYNPHFVDLCTGPGKSSASPKCIAALTGSGLLDSFAQCVGGQILSTNSTVCTVSQFSGLGKVATSAIPPIIAAHIASSNTWTSLSDLQSQRIRAIGILESFIGSFIQNVPCYSCFRALVSSIVELMQNSDIKLVCEDVFSDACLRNSFLKLLMQSFSACTGYQELDKSGSPYSCSAEESLLIQQNSIPQLIFLVSVIQKSTSPTIAIITLRAVLRSVAPNLSCTPCLEQLILDLFSLDSAVVAKCNSAESASDCLKLPAFLNPVISYSRCSGLVFNFATLNTTITTTVSPTVNNHTSSTKNYEKNIDLFKSILFIALVNLLIFS